jgi:hypothetical protein
VFLSYARSNLSWVTNFKKWLAPQLGGAILDDYLEQSSFGDIEENLRSRISGSYAFLVFFSKHYCEQKYTLFEWWAALKRCDTELHRKRLTFVPILLDNDARAWWPSLLQDERCPEWVRRYAYEDFTSPDGSPLAINSQYGPIDSVTSRIEEIARRLRQTCADQRSDPSEPNNTLASTSPIVLLGHPTAALPTPVNQAVETLVAELRGHGAEPSSWKDGWLSDALDTPDQAAPLPSGDPIVLQAVSPGEAREHIEAPGLARQRLGRAIQPAGATTDALTRCRIVLWLPCGARGPDLQHAVKTWDRNDPTLRTDPPSELSAWLLERAGHDSRPEVPLLTLEDLATDDPTVAAARTQLHRQFEHTIKRVVKPAPAVYTFTSRELLDQLHELEGGRAIIAVHDLNTGHTRDKRAARAELRQKLEQVQSDVDREFLAGPAKPSLFWAALIHRKADCVLSVRLGDGVLDRWRAIRFRALEGSLIADERDEPVFRSYVSEWAAGTVPALPPG